MKLKLKRNSDGIVPHADVAKAYRIGKGGKVHTCDERCRTCVYCMPESKCRVITASMTWIACSYILVKKKPRGCPAGAACTKYRKREGEGYEDKAD